jgi:hypothetical protein
MKDLVWRRIGDRGVRPDFVIPALEPRQGGAEGTVLERDHLVCNAFFLESADEALLDGDAAMPANCAEPCANVVVVAPFEVILAELAALIADGVLRCASSPPGRLVKYKADLGARGTPLKNSKAERAARPVVDQWSMTTATHQQKGQDWAKEKGNQLVQNPALVGTAIVSRPQTWFG